MMKSTTTTTTTTRSIYTLLVLTISVLLVILRCRIRSRQLHELSVLDDINTNNNKLLQAQFQVLFNDTYTHPKKKKKKNDKHHYHDYAIFIVYYHKTGCVLSHKLKKLINEVDVTAHLSTGENEVKQKGRRHENKVLIKKFSNSAKFEVSGIHEGERVAFDTLGNWEHSGKSALVLFICV